MGIERIVPVFRVADIERAVSFYCRTLGFVEEFRYAASHNGPTYVGVSLDGHHIHLSTFAGDGVAGTALYCYVDDVDALFERFVAHGLKTPGNPASPVENGPVDQSWNMREFYVRDPDRNTLRFGSRKPEAE